MNKYLHPTTIGWSVKHLVHACFCYLQNPNFFKKLHEEAEFKSMLLILEWFTNSNSINLPFHSEKEFVYFEWAIHIHPGQPEAYIPTQTHFSHKFKLHHYSIHKFKFNPIHLIQNNSLFTLSWYEPKTKSQNLICIIRS